MVLSEDNVQVISGDFFFINTCFLSLFSKTVTALVCLGTKALLAHNNNSKQESITSNCKPSFLLYIINDVNHMTAYFVSVYGLCYCWLLRLLKALTVLVMKAAFCSFFSSYFRIFLRVGRVAQTITMCQFKSLRCPNLKSAGWTVQQKTVICHQDMILNPVISVGKESEQNT